MGQEGLGRGVTIWTLTFANLYRTPMRLALSAIALVVAFLLFVLLQAIASKFDLAAAASSDDRVLISRPKHTSAYNLPATHIEHVVSQPGVAAVTPMLSFTGYYQDRKHGFQSWAANPEALLQTLRDFRVDEDARARFLRTRTGMLVTAPLADEFGWHVGDKVNLQSQIYPQEDGSRSWEFEVAGVLLPKDGRPISPALFFHYAYFNEASRINQHRVTYFAARVDERVDMAAVGRAIDEATAITPEPTMTVSREYLVRSRGRQLGDIGRITSIIIGAVFFTVLLVAGHAAVQGLNERMTELATMRALGFSRR